MNTARKTLFFVAVLLAVLLLAVSVAAAQPKRVLIVVMDQMQPGYAQQFHMKNVLWLQHHGVTFPNAIVGDMASETVVSHNVMVSGQLPKHMGWSDEAFRDVSGSLGYAPAGGIVTSGDLGYADYVKLIEAMGYPKLGDYLHAKYPGTVVANVGEKGYQVESMAASSSDYWVRMGVQEGRQPWPDWPSGQLPRPIGQRALVHHIRPGHIRPDVASPTSPTSATSSASGNPWDTYGTELQFPVLAVSGGWALRAE